MTAESRVLGLPLATEATYRHGYTRRDRRADFQREVLTFLLGVEEYALDIVRIREILRLRPVTEVPRAPSFVLGVLSVRGEVMPVIDLRRRMGMPPQEPTKDTRVLIGVQKDEPCGLLVDAVRQVVRMRDEDIEPPPPSVGGTSEFVAGIGRPRGPDVDPAPAGSGARVLDRRAEAVSLEPERGRTRRGAECSEATCRAERRREAAQQ